MPAAEPPPTPPAVVAAPAADARLPASASPRWAIASILLVSVVCRLAVLRFSHEGNMSPDAAHFLNVARCVGRGEGFSNPAAWPAWLSPDRLPAPETFKDPGFPFAIAALTRLVGDPFRAGQALALLAGVMLPLVVYLLGWRLARDRRVALVAGLIAAASPILIAQSVRVMAESLFTLLLTLAFVAAAAPMPDAGGPLGPDAGPAPRRDRPAWVAGAWLGLAFLVRTQALLAVPALALLLMAERPPRTAVTRIGRALIAMVAIASPLLIRNLLRFGTPLYSDAASFAVWPFVDPLEFSHALTRPPAPLPFLLAHASQVLAHTADALFRYLRSTVPGDILGNPLWAPVVAVGGILGLARWRRWGSVLVYIATIALMMSAVSWNTRYFASTAPFVCLIAALGVVWLADRLAAVARGRGAAAVVAIGAIAAGLALATLQTRRAERELDGAVNPEIAAAIAEAPVIASRLAPGESVMAVTTSYWSWFTDRPSVHLVIAGEPEFMAVVSRYRVRWAALPTSRLAELAARYPGGRLPAALVKDHADPERDVTVFAVRGAPR